MPLLEPYLSPIDFGVLPTNVVFGDVVYPPGGTYGPRRQRNYQFFLVQYGNIIVEIDGRALRLGQGEMLLLTPDHQEFFAFDPQMKTRHSWCHFDWKLPEEARKSIEALTAKVRASERIEHLIALGLAIYHDPGSAPPSIKHLVATIFWEFVSAARAVNPKLQTATLPFALTCVQTYVARRYADPITLSQLAQVASLTPEHLSRSFRKHLGITPITYLWQVRARQGLLSLRHTGLSVEEIAFQSGFKSGAHFSRKLKTLYGQTPSQLRRSYRDVATNPLEIM